MKRTLIALCLTTFLVSCTAKLHPLQGNYDELSIIKSTKPFDVVWSNVIDLFATKGIGIKLIDKSSGLIVSEKTSFINNYTFERAGVPQDGNAWIVLSNIEIAGMQLKPTTVTAEWNIRVKADGSGSIVNVNITNIVAETYTPPGTYTAPKTYVFNAKSTGVLEKSISETIK